jgi:hypothetical protein
MEFAEVQRAAERLLDEARRLPHDDVLAAAVIASLAFLLAAVAWLRAARRARRFRRELAEARAQHADVQEKYDAELKWRLAGERGAAHAPARSDA